MLTKYIQAAMQHAKYEYLEDDRIFIGEIPGFQGVWMDSDTLEECREQLQEVLEEWIVIGLLLNHPLPAVDGLRLRSIDDLKTEAPV